MRLSGAIRKDFQKRWRFFGLRAAFYGMLMDFAWALHTWSWQHYDDICRSDIDAYRAPTTGKREPPSDVPH